MSGPSRKAIAAGAVAVRERNGGPIAQAQGEPGSGTFARDALVAAHDPDLGLDRSVCLRDVVEFARRAPRPLSPEDIKREFGRG